MSDALTEAVERLAGVAFDLIQKDPHQWSTRPCSTCNAVTGIIGKSFGCVLYAEQRKEKK